MTWRAIWKFLAGRKPPPVSVPDLTFLRESRELEQSIGQVDQVGEFLLNKAVARGRLSPETAAAIRLTHPRPDSLIGQELVHQLREGGRGEPEPEPGHGPDDLGAGGDSGHPV